jgi:hypothetical protein
VEAGDTQWVPSRVALATGRQQYWRRGAGVHIDIGLADYGRLRDVEGHLKGRRALLGRSVVVLTRAVHDVPGKRPMDVPAMVVVARLMEVLDMPGERIFRVNVTGQYLVGVDPGDRAPSKDDRQRCADQPGASTAFLVS